MISIDHKRARLSEIDPRSTTVTQIHHTVNTHIAPVSTSRVALASVMTKLAAGEPVSEVLRPAQTFRLRRVNLSFTSRGTLPPHPSQSEPYPNSTSMSPNPNLSTMLSSPLPTHCHPTKCQWQLVYPKRGWYHTPPASHHLHVPSTEPRRDPALTLDRVIGHAPLDFPQTSTTPLHHFTQ